MKESQRTYVAIDLKSFYASVECYERNLDPLTSFLVVADPSRTSKTICLAVSPALKAFGIPGRPRLFEVQKKVEEINKARKFKAGFSEFESTAFDKKEYEANETSKLDFVIAPPQMSHYMATSVKIYETYLELIAPEDIHVYSIDEVFIDITPYLETYKTTAHNLVRELIRRVLKKTGITATAGIGPNLYLAKVAMDIEAKKCEPDKDGVRIAELNKTTYRCNLWSHEPITDFWRVGKGYADSLEKIGLRTMGDVARFSIKNEKNLFELFGVNAELLIDHAWGLESCTMKDIKSFEPDGKSIGSGQVLQEPYSFEKALLVTKEMADALGLDLFSKHYVATKIVLTIGYDVENLNEAEKGSGYQGPIKVDSYGRKVPKPAHGTVSLSRATSSSSEIRKEMEKLFKRIVNPSLLIRRITMSAAVSPKKSVCEESEDTAQLDLFDGTEMAELFDHQDDKRAAKERKMNEAILALRDKFGKNAIVKGMNLEEGATGILRNNQIGGHKA